MYLARLHLLHFKNYRSEAHVFSDQLNLITGPNGTGKTNLLDAIHFLCNTKSAFSSSDATAINQHEAFFRLEGVFEEEMKSDKVECICQREGGKTLLLNGKTPEKLATYIGRFPLVLTSPYDTDLIREGSEVRRRFFDLVLSQSGNGYLERLMTYNRLLKQRNAVLKQMAERGKINIKMLDVYDEQLLPLADFVFQSRHAFLQSFSLQFKNTYKALVHSEETPEVSYSSECAAEDFNARFLANHKNDLLAQRTLLGPHTDDYEFTLNGLSVKKMGSQGQQKTFALSLRLAHFDYILQSRSLKPILLLDDIFDRLDENRIGQLAEMVKGKKFGQVFVTDANPKRIQHVFDFSTKETTLIMTK